MPGIYVFSKTKGNRKDALNLLRGNALHKTKNITTTIAAVTTITAQWVLTLYEVFGERCGDREILVS